GAEQAGEPSDKENGRQVPAKAGPRAHHLGEQSKVRESHRVRAAPSLARDVEPDQQRNGQQAEEQPGGLEAHGVAGASRRPRCASRCLMKWMSCGTTSADVLNSATAARARKRSFLIASRCASAAPWKRARRCALLVSTRICWPFSGSSKVTIPTSGISPSLGSRMQTVTPSWWSAS